jgi:hypothetical protein
MRKCSISVPPLKPQTAIACDGGYYHLAPHFFPCDADTGCELHLAYQGCVPLVEALLYPDRSDFHRIMGNVKAEGGSIGDLANAGAARFCLPGQYWRKRGLDLGGGDSEGTVINVDAELSRDCVLRL